jgi:carbon-monoxide dehydrogenase small subunit
VLADGKPARACLMLAVAATGRDIVTIEGLADGGKLSPLQQAFVDTGAVQCGFCIPGMVLTAKALLDERRDASLEQIREGISGNLCRCSGYVKIIEAVQRAQQGAQT